jgi:drug/metabolite transporter (DMT)-like permease
MVASLPWLWMPITIGAALAQTLRNAAQRHLTAELGTFGATLVRFLYGLPFAVAWLVVLDAQSGVARPAIPLSFPAWVMLGASTQIIATALLLRTMADRSFALGVAYSKTEVVQVAIIGFILLGDPVSLPVAIAVIVATVGVLLISLPAGDRSLGIFLRGWTSRTALLGLASGTMFALSAAGYRGAALSLETAPALEAAYTLASAQLLQTLLLGGWLVWRNFAVVVKVVHAWRVSLFAGFMGALASGLWFTGFALTSAVHVRTLGLIELLFSYVVSQKLFREQLGWSELAGIALLALGIVGVVGFR